MISIWTRTIRHAAIALATAALCFGVAACDAAPPASDTLTLLAPAAPGGGWDQTARAMQQVLQTTGLAPNSQVINVPGAGGIIGLAQVANAYEGDPNLLMITGLIMMGAVLTNDSPVSFDEVTPVARLLGEYEVLVVTRDSPYQTLEAFVAGWKEDPGAFAIAGGSAGGTDHMVTGLLARAVGIDPTTINYLPHSGGGESMASILGGHVAAGINGYAELIPFIEAGRLTPLGISSDEPIAGIDIPTFREQGLDVALANWRGVAAPPGITDEERSSLIALLDQMHASSEWRAALAANNWIDLYMTGADYEAYLEAEDGRTVAVLQSIGLLD